MITLPNMRAGAIMADPPLPFKAWSRKGEGRSPQQHYACLVVEQLSAIPMASVAAPDCFLFLWVPLCNVFVVEPLMNAWGFRFSGSAFVWAKQNRSGIGWHMGLGKGTRHSVETCWLGRRGNPKRLSAGVRELIIAPIREHSRKPDELYMRIEEFCDGPFLELFARQRWPGWTAVGDELDKFQVAS
jgi:N6-adenosine-specific RNA methylase IME4